jgi:hypothetical protein
MNPATRLSARTLPLALAIVLSALAGCVTPPPTPDMRVGADVAVTASGPVPFTLDDNRVFVPVTLVGADGRERRTLAFVNQGFAGPTLSNALYRELDVGQRGPLRIRLGAAEIAVDPQTVQPESEVLDFDLGLSPRQNPATPETQAAYAAKMAQRPGGLMKALVWPLPVEAVIPAGLLQRYRVTLDYGSRTLSLEPPNGPAPEGTPVPIRVDPATGFATLDAVIGGDRRTLVIDCGGSFSSLRLALARADARRHPDWLRSADAIGEAQVSLSEGDLGLPVLRAPQAEVGALTLAPFDVTGFGVTGPVGLIASPAFWTYYSAKAGRRVDGWIAGNVLKSFRLTLDSPAGMSWWLQEAPLGRDELDQAGLVLARDGGAVTVAGIARKDGRPTVAGILPGDRLVSVDGRLVAGLTRGQLLAALHGRPGETHAVVVSRKGVSLSLPAPVTAF